MQLPILYFLLTGDRQYYTQILRPFHQIPNKKQESMRALNISCEISK